MVTVPTRVQEIRDQVANSGFDAMARLNLYRELTFILPLQAGTIVRVSHGAPHRLAGWLGRVTETGLYEVGIDPGQFDREFDSTGQTFICDPDVPPASIDRLFIEDQKWQPPKVKADAAPKLPSDCLLCHQALVRPGSMAVYGDLSAVVVGYVCAYHRLDEIESHGGLNVALGIEGL